MVAKSEAMDHRMFYRSTFETYYTHSLILPATPNSSTAYRPQIMSQKVA
jgi:hypothetical protein